MCAFSDNYAFELAQIAAPYLGVCGIKADIVSAHTVVKVAVLRFALHRTLRQQPQSNDSMRWGPTVAGDVPTIGP